MKKRMVLAVGILLSAGFSCASERKISDKQPWQMTTEERLQEAQQRAQKDAQQKDAQEGHRQCFCETPRRCPQA